MTFPDQSHINKVRDALHRRPGGGASVMVGSGFSQNAISVRPNVGNLPTWDQVTSKLHEELYPDEKRGGYYDPLRTAQEYKAAFGETELYAALGNLVPHGGYNPGDAHHRLLKLPWADIYTTNWDDLLERARSNVTERNYSVITSTDQIPMETRPRIVKLHGSLPGQSGLIATEEDYRTYPTNFAPFVNTVQQAMMETVFFLIGFSGEDPNFLNWSGWVRDNLGESAPKIYLAGYLQLSQHRRRMLEERRVVPIDLARHPQSNQWQEQNLHHQYATQWLLHTLESGEPYDVTEWPSLPSRRAIHIPDIIQPIDTIRSVVPQAEPATGNPEEPTSVEEIKAVTTVWRHNRLMYPGWLTMPSTNRQGMEWRTNEWGHEILRALPDLAPIERLNAIRELVWRQEVLLVPMYPDFESAIAETLDAIDCQNHRLGDTYTPNEDWTTIRDAWRHVAAALVTAARYRLDRDSFEKWVQALAAFQNEDTEIHHRIRHERCLWAIYDFDIESLGASLADWQTENCDPAWMMRKSAILWEAGRDDEAAQLLQHAIVAVRVMPDDQSSVAGPSREAWATLMAIGRDNRQTILKRLRDLVPLRCDVFDEQQSVLDAMGQNNAADEPPVFDINRRRGTSFRHSNYDPQTAAYRAIRLSEIAGLPPFATELATNVKISTTVWAGVLKKAAEEIADENLELAIRLVLRTSSSDTDETLGRVLSRTRLANLQTTQADRLAEACLMIINRAFSNSATANLQSRTEPAIEVLSRLVTRVAADLSQTILGKALEFYRDPQIQRGTWATVIRNLLERSWQAIPNECRHHHALDLLNAPIAGMNSDPPLMGYAWVDPVEMFANDSTILQRTPDNEHQWRSAIDLVVSALAGDTAVRHRASIRMLTLASSGLLTDRESQTIANALWCDQHTPPDGLPTGIRIPDWALLTLPEPMPPIAQKHFITKWMAEDDTTGWQHKNSFEASPSSSNGLNHDTQDMDSRLWQIGAAIGSLQTRGRRLDLPDPKRANLQRMVEVWAEATVPEVAPPEYPFVLRAMGDAHKARIRHVSQVLAAITREVGLSEQTGEKLYSKMQRLKEKQIPALTMATSIVRATPMRSADVATALRVGMTSNQTEMADNAVEGVRQWMEGTMDTESGTPNPPDDLVREIGISIASRRRPVLPSALAAARWIFENGEHTHTKAIRQLALDGLDYLAEELRYERHHDAPDDVPLERLFCAQLAAAMAEGGLQEHPTVTRWLEIAREDPLPEVRNAAPMRKEFEDDQSRSTPPIKRAEEVT